MAVIAPAVHPAGQGHALADVLRAELAAGMGAVGLSGRHGSADGSGTPVWL